MIHEVAQALRPKNNLQSYLPRQKEWRVWCEKQRFAEVTRCVSRALGEMRGWEANDYMCSYTVSGEKLAFFLTECRMEITKDSEGHNTPLTVPSTRAAPTS